MEAHGVKKYDAMAILIDDQVPGIASRHRKIHQNMQIQDLTLSPRDALAESIKKFRKVYKEDNVYNNEINQMLQKYIKINEQKFPELFNKK